MKLSPSNTPVDERGSFSGLKAVGKDASAATSLSECTDHEIPTRHEWLSLPEDRCFIAFFLLQIHPKFPYRCAMAGLLRQLKDLLFDRDHVNSERIAYLEID